MVRHTYNNSTKKLDRELSYKSTEFKEFRASDIVDTLAKTKWPMGQTPVDFVWNGPGSPYYLPAAEMRQQAVRWGLTVEATTSHQRLQPLVVSMAILEYERQFKAAVDAAWQAATTAAVKPDEGQEVAAPEPPPPLGAQPTTGSASTTEQPKEAAAGPIANNQWEVTPPRGGQIWTTRISRGCR